MDRQIQARLVQWRQQTLDEVLNALQRKPPIFISWDEPQNRYTCKTDTAPQVSLPEEAGVYVFYSKKTRNPVYVGETDNLKRRLGHHCRVSGQSVFKRRWVPHWVGPQASVEDVVRFIHAHMYFKYVVLPFGRKEIEADLLGRWNLHGPESVDRSEF